MLVDLQVLANHHVTVHPDHLGEAKVSHIYIYIYILGVYTYIYIYIYTYPVHPDHLGDLGEDVAIHYLFN